MIVNWTATNEDDIESMQLNVLNDTSEETFLVCKEFEEAIVKTSLEPGQYNLTLIAFDICGQNYTSEPYTIDPQQSTSLHTSAETMQDIKMTSSPTVTPSPIVVPSLMMAQSLTSCTCPIVTPTCMEESSSGKELLFV